MVRMGRNGLRTPPQAAPAAPPRRSRAAKPAAVARRSPVVARRAGGRKTRNRRGAGVALFDPRVLSHFARPCHRHVPYTVLRDKISYSFPSLTGDSNVLLFGAFFRPAAAEDSLTDTVGVHGTGGNPPATSNTAIRSLVVDVANQTSRLRLHRLGVTVSVTGTNTAGVMPDGVVHIGVLNTPVDYTSTGVSGTAPGTWNNVATWLISRAEMHQVTAYSLMRKPAHLVSRPIDLLDWESFHPSFTGSNNSDRMTDQLAPICVVVSPTVAVDSLTITVHTEWSAIFSSNLVLQQTARMHPVAPESVWRQGLGEIIETGGIVATAAGQPEVGAALALVGSGMRESGNQTVANL